MSELARPAFDAAEMFRLYLTLLGATMCWAAEGETRAMHEAVAAAFGPAPPAEGAAWPSRRRSSHYAPISV